MKTRMLIAVLFIVAVVASISKFYGNKGEDDLAIDRIELSEEFEPAQQFSDSWVVSSGGPSWSYSDGSSGTSYFVKLVLKKLIITEDRITIEFEEVEQKD